MPDSGIGASVKRREDFRFITGRGRYTDDINRPGQLYAAFVRSPLAHAKVTSIDTAEAAKAPGVVAIYTGADMEGRRHRLAALRLGGHRQERRAAQGAAALAAGARQGALRRRPRRGGDRRKHRPGPRGGRAGRGRLRGAAGGGRGPPTPNRARSSTTRRPATSASTGSWATRPRSTRAFAKASHVSKLDLVKQPPDPQRPWSRGAADRRVRRRHRQLHHLLDQPEPAPAAADPLRLRAEPARAQGPRRRPRRRRRLRFEDLRLRRGDGLHLGVEEAGRQAGQVDGGADGVLPVRRARPRPRHPRRAGDGRRGQVPGTQGRHQGETWAPTSPASPRRCRPTSTPRCWPGQYATPAVQLQRPRPCSPRPRRSTPTRGAGRPEATYVVERMVEVAARDMKMDPGRDPPEELHPARPVPLPDPGRAGFTTSATTSRRWTRRWR